MIQNQKGGAVLELTVNQLKTEKHHRKSWCKEEHHGEDDEDGHHHPDDVEHFFGAFVEEKRHICEWYDYTPWRHFSNAAIRCVSCGDA